jgi:hypothetical protein
VNRWVFLPLIPVGSMLVIRAIAESFRRRRTASELAHADSLIKPASYRFTGTDEAVRERTAKRRRAAAGIRTRAARVDAGAPVSDVLRMVK